MSVCLYFSNFRFSAYGPWKTSTDFEIPRHLSPIFLLILAVYTCLPLPNMLSILFAILVTGFHIFALATYGQQDQAETQEHYRKVSLKAGTRALVSVKAIGPSVNHIEKFIYGGTQNANLHS